MTQTIATLKDELTGIERGCERLLWNVEEVDGMIHHHRRHERRQMCEVVVFWQIC